MSLSTPLPWNAVASGYDKTTRVMLSTYAERALAWADLPPGARVLDVATGPGTLAILAAKSASYVLAVDFSVQMLDHCRRHSAGHSSIEVRHADGQALGIESTFNAAFSMFGLMFFPDRAAGFRSIHQALVPGGAAFIACWPPMERSSAVVVGVGALSAAFPDTPAAVPPILPLNSAAQLRSELEAAGFVDVEVREEQIEFQQDAVSLWRGIADGFAPLALARQSLSDAEWKEAEARGLAWLHTHHSPTDTLCYVALLGRGRKP